MDSADDQVLRAFCLRRFLSDGMGRRLVEVGGNIEKLRDPVAIRSMKYGSFSRFAESLGWLNAGMEIEYFATIEPLDDEFRQAVFERFEREEESEAWPVDFKRVLRILFTQQEHRFIAASDIDSKGFFQAALLAAESFDRRLVARLLFELRRPEDSPLDVPFEVDIDELYGALNSNQHRKAAAVFVAGWLQFVPVLQTFVDVLNHNSAGPSYMGSELSLHVALGSLMSWRLNLTSENTNRRLTNLAAAAFQLIENVRRLNITSINWETDETVSKWHALLTNWEIMTKPAAYLRFGVAASRLFTTESQGIEEEREVRHLEAASTEDDIAHAENEQKLDSSE